MLNALLGSFFLCLTLAGAIAICYVIMLKLLMPKNDDTYFLFLPCYKNTVNIRQKAYGMRVKLNLIGDDRKSKVVVLDCGITEEEKHNLLEICKECNGIYLVPKEYIKDFLNGRI